MDFKLDLESDEVRREEPVVLDCAFVESPASNSSAMLPKILSVSAIPATTIVPPMEPNPHASPLGRKPGSDPAATPPVKLLISTTGADLHPWYSGIQSNIPHRPLELSRYPDQSPTSSNSSDSSSLFGSPTVRSPGARSTSSGDYDCDSTSSSRNVSPFGSPSGSFPVFRFAIPKDEMALRGVLPANLPSLIDESWAAQVEPVEDRMHRYSVDSDTVASQASRVTNE